MKNFKLIMKSLINNDACIEGGRTKRWFFAVIFAVLSLVMAVLPIMVTSLQAQGSDFTAGNYLYNYDNAIVAFSDSLKDNNLSMVVSEDANGRFLAVDKTQWEAAYTANAYKQYVHLNNDSKVDFEVYYTEAVGQEFVDYYTLVSQNKSPIDGSWREAADTARSTSYLIFGRERMVGQLFQPGNTTALSGVSGDYLKLDLGFDFKSLATVEIDGVTYVTSHDDKFSEPNGFLSIDAYRSQIQNRWNDVYDAVYYNTKMVTARDSTLIMLGVDALLIFFMGLMIFILTRGKRNPFRIYTFWETQKIAYWASFTPSLLALIFGFIFTEYAVMIFVMLIGVRIMWMSMKSLKPAM
ncbi:MAG TPA: hypothetical protein PLH17_04285 [Bacilli bacterium]|jgi:hypothetical protein|nr:hypothetical protein [Bacilli bacterium]HPK68081.1 hypothetical protein [Bacilli bacterium]